MASRKRCRGDVATQFKKGNPGSGSKRSRKAGTFEMGNSKNGKSQEGTTARSDTESQRDGDGTGRAPSAAGGADKAASGCGQKRARGTTSTGDNKRKHAHTGGGRGGCKFEEQRAGGAAAAKRGAHRGGGSSGGSNYASRPSELVELDAIEYVAKYATKTKLADCATDCMPPTAGAAAAAAAAASEAGRCFTLDKECPLAAHAAAAVAVTAPLGAPGNERASNERVECDGCSHVRWVLRL